MSALALVAEPPLSPARAELKRLQSEFAAAVAEHEQARRPEARLIEAIAARDSAEAELGKARAADEQRLAEWIGAGCDGERPAASDETIDIERTLPQLRADGAAAETALPLVRHCRWCRSAPAAALWRSIGLAG
jgi:hypothetical protein